MSERIFSPKCIHCRQRTMILTPVPYHTKITYDGGEYDVSIPTLVVPKCSRCSEFVLDDEANRQIDLAFRRVAKLLSPTEIVQEREGIDLT
jgi:hypothetical protein